MKAPVFAQFFGNREPDTPPDIEAAALRSDRFRLERESDWKRLENILARMEKSRLRRLTDDDILALPPLYRTAASSLAVARETSLDAATLTYLEGLVQRAWFQVYGPREGFAGWLRRFLTGGWSRSVREIWLDICIAFAVMVTGTITGWLLVSRDQEWFYSLVDPGMAGGRVPGASREALLETLAQEKQSAGLSTFAASLFANNAGVCILAFALGFAFGIPTLLLLVQNMALLGALWWVFASQGLEIDLAAWLSVHGTTELLGILLAGAAGLHIGRSMAFPGQRSIMTAMSQSGRRAAQVMAGVVIMMIVAALLEAFPRQLVAGNAMRFAIGAGFLIFWAVYFIAVGRNKLWKSDGVSA